MYIYNIYIHIYIYVYIYIYTLYKNFTVRSIFPFRSIVFRNICNNNFIDNT